jgi:hypothetical protein
MPGHATLGAQHLIDRVEADRALGAAGDRVDVQLRVLNIVDDVTRECLRAVVDTSIFGRRVVRELANLIAERGTPG